MTTRGGVNDTGTVFQITSAGTLTTLHGFTGGADGGYPLGGVIQGNDGNLYGTTSQGGANNTGTVFQITTAGTLTTLYSFTGGTNGAIPQAGLVQGSGRQLLRNDLHRRLQHLRHRVLDHLQWRLHDDLAVQQDRRTLPRRRASSKGSDGYFYGTTPLGGSRGEGTAFKVSSTGTFTTLFHFGGSDGTRPSSSLLQAQDGLFYGTTFLGGLPLRHAVSDGLQWRVQHLGQFSR